MREAGQALPLWYADAGEAVLCPGIDRKWLHEIRERFGVAVDVADTADGDFMPCPWGWSAYTRRFYEKAGMNASVLPSNEDIERMRGLSHRRTAAILAERLREMSPDAHLAEPAVQCRNVDEVKKAIRDFDGHAFIKQPWSSSGRGVVSTAGLYADKIVKLADDSIRRQGSVMVERAYDKVVDFARLFESKDGGIIDLGTSVFSTDERGAYIGNMLAPEAERMAVVTRHIEESRLLAAVECVRRVLEAEVAPYYTGILGVDMLVASDGTLDASVELNLRCTMGYVANRFSQFFLHPDARGVMCMRKAGKKESVARFATDSGRIMSGELVLSPVFDNNCFAIRIL